MKVKDIELPSPIEYHETFDVLDSSKIQAFMDCPRGFFFSYVLGLRKDEPNIHLVFGTAWHEAMEHILNNGKSIDSVKDAFDLFMESYLKEYSFAMIDQFASGVTKTPDNAMEYLIRYVQSWRNEEFEVLFTEIAGAVPLSEDLWLWLKMDAVIRDEQGIWSLEHKTTGRNSTAWRDSWSRKVQTGSYTHGLNCGFGEEAQGVIINGLITTKEPQFLRIPVRRRGADMMSWLWEVKHYIGQMHWNFLELSKCTPDDIIMTAFPRNTESCCKYGCKFPDLCSMWQNPLAKFDPEHLPIGYKREYWDPRKRVETSKNIITPDGAITVNPDYDAEKVKKMSRLADGE